MSSNEESAKGKGSTVYKESVMAALKNCYDPEIPINIVDLGLIYDIDIAKDGKININMTLTAIGCPLGEMLAEEVRAELLKLKGVTDVNVNIVWDPPWTPDRMSDEARRSLGL